MARDQCEGQNTSIIANEAEALRYVKSREITWSSLANMVSTLAGLFYCIKEGASRNQNVQHKEIKIKVSHLFNGHARTYGIIVKTETIGKVGEFGRASRRIIGKTGFGGYRPNRKKNRLIYIRLLSHVQREVLG